MSQQLSAAVGEAIRQYVPLHPQMAVMDFGAGTGLVCTQIAELVKNIAAVDISEAMLEKLRTKPELQGKVACFKQNIMQHPLDQQFDLIISAMAMHHIADTDKLVQCLAAHLKPGAMIALADLDSEDGSFHAPHIKGVYHAGFDRAALTQIFAQHGFKDIDFVTAHRIEKEEKNFPVFLLTATKSA